MSKTTNKYKKLVVCCDFETQNIISNENIISKVVAFSFASVFSYSLKYDKVLKDKNDYQILYDTHYYDNYGEECINEFFLHLYQYCESQDTSIAVVFFHNLKNFDGHFLTNYLLENYKPVIRKKSLANNEFQAIYNNGMILEYRLRHNNIDYIFRDTSLHFPQSLKNLGLMVGKFKDEQVDYEMDLKIERQNNTQKYQDYIKYTQQDTLVLREVVLQYLTNTNIDISQGVSSASLVFKIYKEKYQEHNDKLFIDSEYYWDIAYRSYFGGFNYANKQHTFTLHKDVYYFDLNSAYPAVQSGIIPYGTPTTTPFKDAIALHKIYFKKGSFKKELIPIIRSPSIKNKDFIKTYPKNDFVETITDPFIMYVFDKEFNYIKDFYNDLEYEIQETYYYKSSFMFQQYITQLYNQRREYKELLSKATKEQDEANIIKNTMLQFSTKIQLNSLYGKFGENIHRQERVFITNLTHHEVYNNESKILYFNQDKQLWSLEPTNELDNKFLIVHYHPPRKNQTILELTVCEVDKYSNQESFKNCIIASYITMEVRCKLFEQIKELKQDFLYCDTDSIMSLSVPKTMELDNKKLGAWKIEKEGAYFIFFKKKQYVYADQLEIDNNTHFTFCGVNNFSEIAKQCKTLPDLINTPFILSKLGSKKNEFGKALIESDIKFDYEYERMKVLQWRQQNKI